MKLKILQREHKEVETEFDLPVYLYFQGEYSDDEYIKITEKSKIKIKSEHNSFSITVEANRFTEAFDFERHLITEEDFNERYLDALKFISNSVEGITGPTCNNCKYWLKVKQATPCPDCNDDLNLFEEK